MEEIQAIIKLKHGDVDGLATLANHYYLQAVRAAYLVLQDHDLAEDVVQTSFVSLISKITQFDETKPFRPWFLRSVINNSISVCRQSKSTVSLDQVNDDHYLGQLLNLSDEEYSLEDAFITTEIRTVVWHALEQLTPQQRAAVVLRYYLELSENELTEELQRPKSTIKWLLFSARRKLRQLLAPLQHDDVLSDTIPNQEKPI